VGYLFDAVDLKTEDIIGAGYVVIARPASAGQIRLLEVWDCPTCEAERWAMIEIVGGKLERIEAAAMGRATFESANFISDVSAELLASTLLGISWAEFGERKLLSANVLRQCLV
jgi:hypothetical protein